VFKDELEARVRKLVGNQARITLLYLIAQGQKSDTRLLELDKALEIGETYHPESQLKSF